MSCVSCELCVKCCVRGCVCACVGVIGVGAHWLDRGFVCQLRLLVFVFGILLQSDVGPHTACFPFSRVFFLG